MEPTEYNTLMDRVVAEMPYFFQDVATEGIGIDVQHGTTIVGVKSVDAVVLGGDTRSSIGMNVHNDRKRKVHVLDSASAMGAAGTGATCDSFARLFSVLFSNHARTHRNELHFDTRSRIVSSTLGRNVAGARMGLLAVPVLAGYQQSEGPRLTSFDGIGGESQERYFTAIGSGGHSATAVCNTLWKSYGGREMTADKAIELTVDALVHSTIVQTGSAFPNVYREILPNVILIDKDGADFVPKEIIERKVQSFSERFGDV